ncbi:MAG: hypothetical protein NTU91_12295 [Chloroflexi bacterium]|nr:hypothetical protein [Chloroflexota bacterium]
MGSKVSETNTHGGGRQFPDFDAAWQAALILTILVLFWGLASVSARTARPDPVARGVGAVILMLLWMPAVIITIRELRDHTVSLRALLRENPQLWIAALYLALAARDVNQIPMCDNGAYFRMVLEAVQLFDFVPGDSLRAMALAGHPAQAYAAYMMLGQFLGFGNFAIANLQMYLLHVVEICCFWGIVGKLFPGRDRRWERLLATALFAFTPLVYGLSLTISPDFAVLTFFCLVLWAVLRKHGTLAVASGVMLCFSKEFGALLYAGLVLGIFGVLVPYDACRGLAPRRRSLAMEWKTHLPLLLPLVLYALYLALGGSLWRLSSAQDAASALLHPLDPWILWDKTIQLFLANFNWSVWGLIGACIPLAFIWRRRKESQPPAPSGPGVWFVVLGVAMVPFLLLNYLLVTWSNARYVLPVCPVAILLLVRALESWVRPIQVRAGALAILLALFGASCFRTLDPVLFRAFSTFTFGEHRMSFYNSMPTICDLTFYNREYVYYNRLFDRFLSEVGYDPEVDEFVFFTGGVWAELANHNFEYLWTGGRLLGPMYVETGTLKRSFLPTGNSLLRSTIYVSGETNPSSLPGHAYLIEPFWMSEQRAISATEMNTFYRVVRVIRVEEDGYSLVGYELARRD